MIMGFNIINNRLLFSLIELEFNVVKYSTKNNTVFCFATKKVSIDNLELNFLVTIDFRDESIIIKLTHNPTATTVVQKISLYECLVGKHTTLVVGCKQGLFIFFTNVLKIF